MSTYDTEDIVARHAAELAERATTIAQLRAELAEARRYGTEADVLRPEVIAFAQAMETKLKANDWRGGWKDERPAYCIGRAEIEIAELVHAIARKQPVLDECADVANFLMMLADVSGELNVAAVRATQATEGEAPLPGLQCTEFQCDPETGRVVFRCAREKGHSGPHEGRKATEGDK